MSVSPFTGTNYAWVRARPGGKTNIWDVWRPLSDFDFKQVGMDSKRLAYQLQRSRALLRQGGLYLGITGVKENLLPSDSIFQRPTRLNCAELTSSRAAENGQDAHAVPHGRYQRRIEAQISQPLFRPRSLRTQGWLRHSCRVRLSHRLIYPAADTGNLTLHLLPWSKSLWIHRPARPAAACTSSLQKREGYTVRAKWPWPRRRWNPHAFLLSKCACTPMAWRIPVATSAHEFLRAHHGARMFTARLGTSWAAIHSR